VRQEGLSAAMACDKADDAEGTGAALVLSTDGGCLLNLGGTLARRGSALGTVHIAQFLWERTHAR